MKVLPVRARALQRLRMAGSWSDGLTSRTAPRDVALEPKPLCRLLTVGDQKKFARVLNKGNQCQEELDRFCSCFLRLSAALSPSQPFDLVITNGHIIDGTGSPWYSGDIGIRDGKIAAIGNLNDAPTQAHHRRRTARSLLPASSTCSASRSRPFWSIRGCPRRSTRASPPRSPAKAVPPRR